LDIRFLNDRGRGLLGSAPGFWERRKDAATALVVYQADGWDRSYGVTAEIKTFRAARKPVVFWAPGKQVPKEVVSGVALMTTLAGWLAGAQARYRDRATIAVRATIATVSRLASAVRAARENVQ